MSQPDPASDPASDPDTNPGSTPGPASRLAEVVRAEVVLGCPELDPTLAFFTDQLGFSLRTIFPADGPTTAVVDGHGLRLRLVAGAGLPPGRLRLYCDDPPVSAAGQSVVAPNGTVIELVPASPTLDLPPLEPRFELARPDAGAFDPGRAGMRYRDLLPSRQGGRFVASHIVIPDGGPVPDYVHYHRIRFQMIYCRRGWVRVVYEDQGPPFVMEAGDCVLQPPEIRHRVLESSPGLEVVEVGCPAVHDTMTDPELDLPTATLDPNRVYGASAPYQPQRFVRHQARTAPWVAEPARGWEQRDTGIAAATGGLASVRVLRPLAGSSQTGTSEAGTGPTLAAPTGTELCLVYVLEGTVELRRPDREPPLTLTADDSVNLAPGDGHALNAWSADAQLLHVTLPAGT